MMRALTCHHDVGRRSSRATMSSTVERLLTASMCPSRISLSAISLLLAGQLQKLCGIVEADIALHALIERDPVDEMRGLVHRFEWIIGRKQNVVVSERT